jgi:hypothetical protein
VHIARCINISAVRLALTGSIIVLSGVNHGVMATVIPPDSPVIKINIPYIFGRLGPVTVPLEAPDGAVVPDDFCLPRKIEQCGDHLRDSDGFSPTAQSLGGPVFISDENPAFAFAPTRMWAQSQFRQTSQARIFETTD